MVDEKRAIKTKKEIFNGVEIETIFRETRRPYAISDGMTQRMQARYCPPLNPRSYIPEPGIVCDQDVAVTLRDGTIIYCDIYKPIGQTNLPTIISWSYYGKRPAESMSEWQIMGVPPGTVSKMAKFESADPGYWCHQGYAVANVDPRGVGHSQGDIYQYCTQDGRDGYDFIEWLATQHWSNGKSALFGNSGVCMPQWKIAAEQPPHLTCIAAWEGVGDLYRESLYEGGVPSFGFNAMNVAGLVGENFVDDTVAMAIKYPLINEYWEDKIPKWENIRVPAYVCAGWNHFHLRGSTEGFRRIRSAKKWLRAHREFEWPDTYSPFGLAELKRFYDRYLKDIRNGFELTPRVRIDVMDAYDYDFQPVRPEKEFPLARTQYKKLYLDASNHSLSFNPVAKESKVSYEGKEGLTTFDITFNEDTEITGYLKLHLWVEAEGNDDMDLFIIVRKLDEKGEWIPVNALDNPHPGLYGKFRASRRELDPKWSTDFQPVQAHRKDEKLHPGEIVPCEIEILPTSRIWHKGQQLRVIVTGHYISENWFLPVSYDPENKGNHIIHTGGKYDSYLQIPVIPPKYQAGDYIYR